MDEATTNPQTQSQGPTLDPEIAQLVDAEIEKLKEQGQLVYIEPRCKICRNPLVRTQVNRLLGMGLTRTSILSVLEPVNDKLPESERITYDNIRQHQKRHFDVSVPARAVYDQIVRRRAAENDPDFENAVGAAVNVFSYLETMMLKGFEDLVDEDTKVPYTHGARAAVQLHELLSRSSDTQQMAQLIARQNRIVDAVREFVPPEQMEQFLARVEGRGEGPREIKGEFVRDETPLEVEEFDPDTDVDEDDDDEEGDD